MMNGIWNCRWLKSLAVVLIAFGLIAGSLSLNAAGQSTRARRTSDESQKKESQQESKKATEADTQTPGQQRPEPPKQDPQKPTEKKPVPEPEAEPIRIKTNLVAVPVSVTDEQGNPIRNLRVEDFQLEEEGAPQQIQTLGEPGKTPIELALLFDVSRSVRNRFDFEREAAGRFLKQVLKPGDAVTVFSIGSTPKLSVQRTDNVDKAVAATSAIEPTEEATAFFDTVVRAARHLSDSANPGVRRVIVVISDGEDTNSERFRLPDATRELQRADSLLYAINPSGP